MKYSPNIAFSASTARRSAQTRATSIMSRRRNSSFSQSSDLSVFTTSGRSAKKPFGFSSGQRPRLFAVIRPSPISRSTGRNAFQRQTFCMFVETGIVFIQRSDIARASSGYRRAQ